MVENHNREPQLNDKLAPKDFEICIPKSCSLLRSWKKPEEWIEYLEELAKAHKLPLPEPRNLQTSCECKDCGDESCSDKVECCCTCDCEPGWKLSGELAIAHACRVHDRIHRQILTFEQVSAVDVGFAIWERQTEFGNFLAIRIHVNRKLPPEQLRQMGIQNFTPKDAAFSRRADDSIPAESGAGGLSESQTTCEASTRFRKLREILDEEFENREPHRPESFPISGVRQEDLSIFCPRSVRETKTIEDIRLCICGVPIDIINAQYNPSMIHPGGDADSGVFTDPPQQSRRLNNEEHLLIGRGRVNPLVGGISVGSTTGQAGTLATIVWDRTDGTPCALSNWHVLAGTQQAQVDQPSYQPSLFDGGTEDDVVARLKRWTLGEEGDAAIAELTNARNYASGEILGMWHPVSGSLAPKLNMEVRKWGRTTGFTQGFIDGIHLATNIDYGNGVIRYFANQFHIAPLFAGKDVSQVGDSGSLVLTRLKPIQQKEHIEQLYEWLELCCDAKGQTILCENIKKEGDALNESLSKDCPSSPATTLVKAAIEDLTSNCEKENTHQLLQKIKTHFLEPGEIQKTCEQLEECASFCEQVSTFFENLRELSTDTSVRTCEICYLIHNHGLECPQGDHCKSYGEAFSTAIAALKAACDVKDGGEKLCQVIREHEKILNKTCQNISKNVACCPDITEKFESWKARCLEILRAQHLIEELCNIANRKQQVISYKDISEFIAAVKPDFLEKSRNAPSDDELLENDSLAGPKPDLRKPESEDKCADFTTQFGDCLKELDFDPEKSEHWFIQLLKESLSREDVFRAVLDQARTHIDSLADKEARDETRVYYAVGMIFAGDTPGSPFGEFAVASDIERLAEELRFSMRPVFEPRSSFRELRERPPARRRTNRASTSSQSLAPGAQRAARRSGGPQPDLESGDTGTGDG